MTATETTTSPLAHLLSLAIRAHSFTSFSPEVRGANMVKEYGDELTADIERIQTTAAKFNADPTEQIARYKKNYETGLTNWLSAKGRCYSAMITGPANFNERRHRKANVSESNKYEVFRTWRDKALKAITKSFAPPVTVETELSRYQKELASLERNHQIMKDANAIIRKAKGADCTTELVAIGLHEDSAKEIQQPKRFGGMGFASFSLTNNNANIKRVQERIKVMESKAANIERGETPEYNFEGGKIVINHEADRLQIMYDQKPDPTTISNLKRNGFKWAPSVPAWQRQLTANAKYAARAVTGIKL